MKFITEFTEEEQIKAVEQSVDIIQSFLTATELKKILQTVPKGEFKTDKEKLEAAGNQGFKNILNVIKRVCAEHSNEAIAINRLLWKPTLAKRPVMITEWDEEGFPVETYKKDKDGHVVFEEYQETEADYPNLFKTIAYLPIVIKKDRWLIDFFTSMLWLKEMF